MDYKRKKNGKKGLHRVMGMALAVALLFGIPCSRVAAAEEEPQEKEPVKLELTVYELPENDRPALRTMLIQCSVCFTSQPEGLCVDLSTCATRTASVLGTKDIVLEEKNLLGWHTVGTAEGYEVYNQSTSGCSCVYTGAVYGKKYRIKCTHYGNVDGYTEVQQTTDAYTYNYK